MISDRAQITENIRLILPDLKGHMASAANYLLSHPNDVAVYSMRELARQARVPPVTLVRLAQRLGLPGFGEMRQTYVDSILKQAGSAGHATRRNIESARAILVETGAEDGLLAFARAFFSTECEILRLAVDGLEEKSLARVADILAKAPRVFVMGRRTTYPPAFILAYALRKARRDVILLDDVAGAPEGALEDAAPGDAFVGFTFAPFSRSTDTLARRAGSANAHVIGISDSRAAPLRDLAGDLFFLTPAQSQAFPESSGGAIVLANLFAALTIAKLGDSAYKRIASNEEFLVSSGEYMQSAKRSRRTPSA
ncbi:MurR/RpiR family transcriptional regulator [Bosea sp. 2KB_26]|uniref:MurR/RpiR family transcriptional regulator n=1 Tax=Bosea sp. 2KB_26 TaxID=3237475 RepID=UPI003F8FD43B